MHPEKFLRIGPALSFPGTNVDCVVVSFPGTKVHGNETSRYPQSLGSRGGAKKSFRGHMASIEPETPKAWSEAPRVKTPKLASRRWGMGREYPRGLGERRNSPSPDEKGFYCFLIPLVATFVEN